MSTLRTDSLQTTDSLTTIQVADLAFINKSTFPLVTTAALLRGVDSAEVSTATLPEKGLYVVDFTDTTSTDNDGDVIVGTDGARWKNINTQKLSVKVYGAKGDGVTDDTAAFVKAIAASSFLYVPAGVYVINSTLTFPDRDLTIVGEGVGTSELRFGAVSTGITATFSDSITSVDVRDLLLTTTQSGVGTAASFTWPEDFEHGFTARAYFSRLAVRGVDDYLDGWSKGVVLTQCDNATFVSCSFKGQGGSPATFTQAANTVSLHGVELLGRYSPTDFHFTNCWFYCWQDGLYIGDTAEGVILTSCTFVEVMRGVSWATGLWSLSYPVNPGGNASGRPQLVLSGCHVSCFQKAVNTNGVVGVHVSDCLFYHNDRATQVGNLIEIVNSTDCFIHDTELWSFNSAFGTNGVVFGSNVTASHVHDVHIVNPSGNVFVGVLLQPGANSNYVYNITKRGSITTSLILDQGVANAIGRRGVLAYNVAAISVADSSDVVVPFSNTVYDTDNFWSGAGGNLTIPSGVSTVRLTASAVFDVNAAGARKIAIYRAGSISYAGQGSCTVNATSGLSTQLNCATGVLRVAEGDVFSLVVLQNSGGALNVQPTITSLSIEVLS